MYQQSVLKFVYNFVIVKNNFVNFHEIVFIKKVHSCIRHNMSIWKLHRLLIGILKIGHCYFIMNIEFIKSDLPTKRNYQYFLLIICQLTKATAM